MPGDRFIELATAEDRRVLEVLFGHAGEAVTVQDVSGRLVYANDMAAAFMGLQRGEELMALPPDQLTSSYDMIDRQGNPLDPEDLPGRRVMNGQPFAEAVIGYRSRGSKRPAWSHVRASPIQNDRREVVLVINFFSDITDDVVREEADQVRTEVYDVLGSSLDRREILTSVAGTLVPRVAGWCAVHLVEGRRLEPVAATSPDDGTAHMLIEDVAERVVLFDEDNIVARVARSGRPESHKRVSKEGPGPDGDRVLDRGPVAVIPVVIGRQVIGTLTVARPESEARFGDADLELLGDVADRTASVLENALLYEQQRKIAATLQAVLTPRTLPEVPGLEVSGRYRPISLIGHVGGDFYDVIPAPGRGYAVVLGDIAGKGVDAAAAVGLARYTIRSTVALDPGCETVASQINEALLEEDRMCTIAYVFLEPSDDGFQATVMLAGHPPPILVTPEGAIRRLGRPCPPAGILPSITPIVETHTLREGDTVVLYTDGFAFPDVDPPDSVERAISKLPHDTPDQLVDDMLGLLLAERVQVRDDIALLVLKVTGPVV